MSGSETRSGVRFGDDGASSTSPGSGCEEHQRLHLAARAERDGWRESDGSPGMFSLPFISCFSHLDSEIPGVFLSGLFLARGQTYPSHAEKHTKSSNLSSPPLLFCHAGLNCISSAAQPHLGGVQPPCRRRERSIPVPRGKGRGFMRGSCEIRTENDTLE